MDATTSSTRPATTRRMPFTRVETPDFATLKSQLATLNPDRDGLKRQHPDDTINTEDVLGSPRPLQNPLRQPINTQPHRIAPPPRIFARPPPVQTHIPPPATNSANPAPQIHHRLEQMLTNKQTEITRLKQQIDEEKLNSEQAKHELARTKDGQIQALKRDIAALKQEIHSKDLFSKTLKSEYETNKHATVREIDALKAELADARKSGERAEQLVEKETAGRRRLFKEWEEFKAKVVRLTSELETARANENIAKEQYATAKQTADTANAESKLMREKNAEFTRQYLDLQQVLETERQEKVHLGEDFEREKERLLAEISNDRSKNETLEHENDKFKYAHEALNRQIAGYKRELGECRTSYAEAKDNLEKVKGELAQQKVANEASPVALALGEKLREAERRATAAETLAAERQRSMEALESKVKEMDQHIKTELGKPMIINLHQEIEARGQENARLADTNNKLESTIMHLKRREQDLMREGNLLNNKLETANAQLNEVAPDSQRLRSCMSELSELQLKFDQLHNEYEFQINKLKAQCEAAVDSERQQAAGKQRVLQQELEGAAEAHQRELEQKLAEVSGQAAANLAKTLESQQANMRAQLQEQLAQVERLSEERTQQIQNVAELEVSKHNSKLEEWFSAQLEQQQQQVDSRYKKKYRQALEAMELVLTYNDHVQLRARAVDEDLIFIKDIAARCLAQIEHDEYQARLMRGVPGEKKTAKGRFLAVLALVRLTRGNWRPKVPVKLEQEYRSWAQ